MAVTGDGVNDVPALQGADIGIAMGDRGTRAAREAAAIVLLDDNFRTIVRAIAEGRQLFLNLRLSFAYLLMIHAPLVITAAVVPLLGYPLLLLPVHVVWLELIIHPTALLAFQKPARTGELGSISRRAGLQLFAMGELCVIAGVALVITLVMLVGFHFALGAADDVPHARTMAIVTLVSASATVTAGLLGLGSRVSWFGLFATISSAAVLVQTPSLSELVHLSRLHFADWAIAATGGLVSGLGAAVLPKLQSPGQVQVL